ncbi:hypothetical protein EJB05_19914 [Eragrostis curvula]|uniref:Uncharacterized protein n=1 Tax=Eragrostis curvula TaxID=38414 RepID=A0A5J9UZ66_9POAL|nr:hypothetical protein EJB05_19914 [Eragrostis curvula]
MDADANMMIPSSPSTETSRSSSDIATESTGSFFRDRSTTLGTLMGVSLDDDEQGQGQGQEQEGQDAGEERQRPRTLTQEADGWRWRRKWRRRRWRNSGGGGWWRMCRDDIRMPTSLGHFLDMERRVSGTGLLCGAGNGERAVAVAAAAPLLENGTAPPSAAVGVAGEERGKWKLRRPAQGPSASLARLPVLLTAICSGGAG